MALRAVTSLRPAAVPICDGFTCLVPMQFSAGFGDNLYFGRLGASNGTVPGSGITSAFLAAAMTAAEAEFPLLAPIFSESDANCLDLMHATRNFVSCSLYVHSVTMKDIISDASRKLGSPFLGVSAVDTGLLLAKDTAGQSSDATQDVSSEQSSDATQDVSSEQSSDATLVPQDVSAGQSSDVVQVLKEQLSEVTERAKNLDAENRKLREDVDKAREADNQRSYEIQMEKVRLNHIEEMARIEAGKGDKSHNDSGSGKDKKDSGSGEDKKGNGSGKDKGNGSGKDNKDEETVIKKLLNLLMAPSKAEQFCKDITSNWAKWSTILAVVLLLFGLKQADFLKILSGDFSGIDPRVVVVESRACPCGIPWPEKCSRCGRLLPKFVGDSGLASFPGVAASTATTAVTRVTPPQATGIAAAKGDTSTVTTAVTKAMPPRATGVAAAKGHTSTSIAATAVIKATPLQAAVVAAAKGDTSTATTAVIKATPLQATVVAAAKGDTSTATTAVTKATPPQVTGVAAAKGDTSTAVK